MKLSTVFAIGLLIGALGGLGVGINIGNEQPLFSNPLKPVPPCDCGPRAAE